MPRHVASCCWARACPLPGPPGPGAAPRRRGLLVGACVLFAWAHVPRIARAEGRDPRMLVIVLRGALDGLAMVAPGGGPGSGGLGGGKARPPAGEAPAPP